MRKIMFILLVVTVLIVSPAVVFVHHCGCQHYHEKIEAGEAEAVNTVCPVMGNKIDKDTPYTVEYEGKTIGFCCAACIDKFNTDPEKYLDKLEEE